MSIGQLSETLQKHIIAKYTKEISLGSLGTASMQKLASQVTSKKGFRSAFESGEAGHDSIITKAGLTSLLDSLQSTAQEGAVKQLAEDLLQNLDFGHFVTWLQTEKLGRTKSTAKEITEGVKLERIPQSSTKKYFVEYITKILDESSFASQRSSLTKQKLVKHISDNIQAGHLAGIFSLKFKVGLGLDIDTSSMKTYRDFKISLGTEGTSELEETLDVMLKAILDADFLTSNVVDREEVFLIAVKYALGENPRLQTEMQFRKDNEASGNLLAQAGRSLNSLIERFSRGSYSADAQRDLNALVMSLKNMQQELDIRAKELLKSTDPKSVQIAKDILTNSQTLSTLINSPGSVPIVKGIGLTIAEVMRSGKILAETKTTAKVTKKLPARKDPETVKLNKVLKKTADNLKKSKQSIKKQTAEVTVKLRTLKGGYYSLANLQYLINSMLAETIKRNMGDGSRRDILNLRSGRFADSVTVDRMSGTRDSMITAFYTYMKYPYQTFEPGYKQGRPETRNPKLLISKSIREIAAEKVANKLRAVSL